MQQFRLLVHVDNNRCRQEFTSYDANNRRSDAESIWYDANTRRDDARNGRYDANNRHISAYLQRNFAPQFKSIHVLPRFTSIPPRFKSVIPRFTSVLPRFISVTAESTINHVDKARVYLYISYIPSYPLHPPCPHISSTMAQQEMYHEMLRS